MARRRIESVGRTAARAAAPNASGRRVQLHRALSKLGWGSRTQAWDWIVAGQVRVDGQVVTDPLSWVDLDRQRIARGQQETAVEAATLALHKPRGVVTTRRDERGRRTVYDFLPAELPWLFPVGRLDADSEGLLIFTNDAALAVCLTEPDRHVPKTYLVTLRDAPAAAALAQVRRGVELSDGPTRPARVRVMEQHATGAVVEMVLTEGRNRQVRRTWAALGHKVRRLVRVAIGGYALGDLGVGEWRMLGAADLDRLQTVSPPGEHGPEARGETIKPARGTGEPPRRRAGR